MAESSLTVHLRPVANEQEQVALDAALDTLIFMAMRGIVAEREYRKAVERGYEKNAVIEINTSRVNA